MKKTISIFAASLLCAITLCSASFRASAKEDHSLRLLYWNIQNGMWDGQEDNYQKFVDFVNSKDPDICVWCEAQSIWKTGLGEKMAAEDRYLPDHWGDLMERYGHKYWMIGGHRDNYPQVITSKYPIKMVSQIVGEEPDSVVTHGAGWFQIEKDGQTINVVTLHTWPQSFAYRAADRAESTKANGGDWYRRMEIEYICKHTIGSVEGADKQLWMMMGDFNSRSRSDNMEYKYPENTTKLIVHDYIAEETPYIDVVKAKHPDTFISSTWGKSRIDFVYCTKPLYDKVTSAEIIRDSYTEPVREQSITNQAFFHPSDHLPILVDFDMSVPAEKAKETLNIIPQPEKVTMGDGSCNLAGARVKAGKGIDKKSKALIGEFGELLDEAGKGISAKGKAGIAFAYDAGIKPEAYSIRIGASKVDVKASSYNGFLYAIQTLKQLLPSELYDLSKGAPASMSIPCCTIEDAPRFQYRGLMLDCSRHFWEVDEIKKCLNAMSIYKLNRFHWHLTDDQGWRIEIKKYPKLTEVGAWRNGTMIAKDFDSNDGKRYGGYYTQAQLKEVIAYAEKLGITIVPEIDLPGHMQAALASYPELGCQGSQPQPYKVWTRWGVSQQVLCVGNEKTMQFLEDVVSEVADIFPGEYIHIGGDECPRTEWKADPTCQAKIRELGLVSDEKASAEARLQNYVTARIQKALAAKGKKVIGWDEILEGELAPGVAVMSWRGSKGGIKASSMGYDVIMTPNYYCYFDHCQSIDQEHEPLCITRPTARERAVTLGKVYNWDPCNGVDEAAKKHILGAQANLWAEYIATPEHLEYMLFPRLLALSEDQWCQPQNKDYRRFLSTLETKEKGILNLLGFNYRGK